jgi:hypothetical protein
LENSTVKITYKDDPYNVPDGRYLATFTKVEPFSSPTAKDKDGNAIPPGLKWVWTIAEGEHKGCLTNKITAATPTKKNSCGRIIQAIFDGMVDDGTDIDTAQMVGAFYRISVVEGNVSDNPSPKFLGHNRPTEEGTKKGASGSSNNGGDTKNKSPDVETPF